MNPLLSSLKSCFSCQKNDKSELKLDEIDDPIDDYKSEYQTKKHNPKLKKGEKIYSSQISENIFNLFNINNLDNKKIESNTSPEKIYNLFELKPFSFDSKVNYSEEEIKNFKKLKIETEDIDNDKEDELDLFYGKILIMNAGGLEKGKRNLKDGYAFFGTVEIVKNVIINDFIVNYPNNENNSKLFYIYFDRNSLKYNLIPDKENKNEKIYVKLNHNFEIKEKTLFSIANINFSTEIIDDNEIKLIIFFDKGKQEKKLQKTKGYYTIGRKKECDFLIRIPVISKIHCSILYKKENNLWMICDGDFKNNKKSTNGIWKYINDKFEIQDEITYFNLGIHNFKCTLFD